MTGAEFVAEAYLKAQGKVSDLTALDDDWIKLIALGNYYQAAWVNEPGVFWTSRYSPKVSCGTVTATDTFNLAATIYHLSNQRGDTVRIVFTDTTRWSDWTVVSPERLKYFNSGNYVCKVGSTLVFNKTFKTTDPEFGGTISAPAYTLPSDLAADGSSTVAVDNPKWLTTISAAEYVRNDLVLQNQYPNLITEANELMKRMKQDNAPQLATLTLEKATVDRTF